MENKHPKANKSIFKKWWFWVFIVVILAAIFGNTDDTIQPGTSSDTFVAEVKATIQDAINTDEEFIVDVVLKNGDLCVTVDLRKANPEPLTMEDLAISRAESITDAILELTDYDSQWNTITIDFGEVGKITNSKSNVEENDFGGRYFPSENFTLE